MNQKQSKKADTYSSGFYVPDAQQKQHRSWPRMHRRRKGCLTIVLVLALATGSWMWYRSQVTAHGDITPSSLNAPFSILHPISSLEARRTEQATWGAVEAQNPTAMVHELTLEDAFFRRMTTKARQWQVVALATPKQLTAPLDGDLEVTSPFGPREHPVIGQELDHLGIDLVAPLGTSVKAAERGVVAWEGRKWGYGNCIVIRHSTHLASIYGHLSHINVHVGQSVSKGEAIGLSGSTGFSTGPHLHFEVRRDGTPVNPLPLLASSSGG